MNCVFVFAFLHFNRLSLKGNFGKKNRQFAKRFKKTSTCNLN